MATDIKDTAANLKAASDTLEDVGTKLERIIERLNAGGDKFNSRIENLTRQSVDLNNIFDHMADTMKDELPKGIITGTDLQKKMLSNAKLFNKIQEETMSLTKETLKEGWAKIEAKMKDTNKSADQIAEAQERWNTLSDFAIKQKIKEFALLKRQKEQIKSINVLNISGKKLIDDLERGWKQPSARIEEYLDILSVLPTKFKELADKRKEFNKLEPAQKRAALAATGMGLAWTGVTAALTVVFKAFKSVYDFVDTKVLPSNANLNREFGNVGSSLKGIKSQAVSVGMQFEQLGLSFEEGADSVKNIAAAMMTVDIPKKTLKEALILSEYIGLGAEQTGKLLRQFQAVGTSGDQAGQAFKDVGKAALAYDVPVNQVRRDLGDNIDILQRFKIKNIQVMAESAAKARAYGLSIREVNAAFGDQLDTFEGSSEVAAKLNSIFGTHINSYKLMLEEDPVKKMEMVRKALNNQGKSWEKLSFIEQNLVKSIFPGMDKQQLQLALGSEKLQKSIKAQLNERQKQAIVDAEWSKNLGNIKKSIVELTPKVRNLFMSIGDFLTKLFGDGSAGDKMQDLGQKFGAGIDKMTKAITDFTNSGGMRDLKENVEAIGATIDLLYNKMMKVINIGKSIIDFSPFGEKYSNTLGIAEQMQAQKKNFTNIVSPLPGPMSIKNKEFSDIISPLPAKVTNFSNIASDNSWSNKRQQSPKEDYYSAVNKHTSMKDDFILEVMPMYLNGTKVGEATVKMSRK